MIFKDIYKIIKSISLYWTTHFNNVYGNVVKGSYMVASLRDRWIGDRKLFSDEINGRKGSGLLLVDEDIYSGALKGQVTKRCSVVVLSGRNGFLWRDRANFMYEGMALGRRDRGEGNSQLNS